MTFHTDERNQPADNWRTEKPNSPRKPRLSKCSLCGKEFDIEESKSMPFCSTRCRQIDLGNWLNEGYGLPVESGDYNGVEDDLEE